MPHGTGWQEWSEGKCITVIASKAPPPLMHCPSHWVDGGAVDHVGGSAARCPSSLVPWEGGRGRQSTYPSIESKHCFLTELCRQKLDPQKRLCSNCHLLMRGRLIPNYKITHHSVFIFFYTSSIICQLQQDFNKHPRMMKSPHHTTKGERKTHSVFEAKKRVLFRGSSQHLCKF